MIQVLLALGLLTLFASAPLRAENSSPPDESESVELDDDEEGYDLPVTPDTSDEEEGYGIDISQDEPGQAEPTSTSLGGGFWITPVVESTFEDPIPLNPTPSTLLPLPAPQPVVPAPAPPAVVAPTPTPTPPAVVAPTPAPAPAPTETVFPPQEPEPGLVITPETINTWQDQCCEDTGPYPEPDYPLPEPFCNVQWCPSTQPAPQPTEPCCPVIPVVQPSVCCPQPCRCPPPCQCPSPCCDVQPQPCCPQPCRCPQPCQCPSPCCEKQPQGSCSPAAKVYAPPIRSMPRLVDERGPGACVQVNCVTVVGASLLSTEQLNRIANRYAKQKLTIDELEDIAYQIKLAYVKASLPAVKVYVPTQSLQYGIVVIVVVESV